jgi:glycosyltransferase involved in cell wall biosynthesis
MPRTRAFGGVSMLTVLLATYNGASQLRQTLASLEGVAVPVGGWKLVVSENGSRDDTPAVLDAFRSRLPLTVVREPRQGKNTALNTALDQLEGDLAVFTDDDIIADPDWLVALRRAADSHRDYAIFGGAIRPIWPWTPNPWIIEWVDQEVCYSVTDPARAEGPVAPNLVWGPNMAIRAELFAAGVRFDEGVGPSGHDAPSGRDSPMGSETELTLRLAAAGHRAWFCSDARVGHIIRPEQMSRQWVLARATRFGRGMYRRDLKRMSSTPPLLFGVPRYLFRMLLAKVRRYVLAVPSSARARFAARWEIQYVIGCIREARRYFDRG